MDAFFFKFGTTIIKPSIRKSYENCVKPMIYPLTRKIDSDLEEV